MRIAWLTDWHGIFVDRDAWELALRLTQEFKPTHVPVGSDDLDFYRISRFDKDPKRRESVQDELDTQWELYRELKDAVDPLWNSLSPRPVDYTPVRHPTVLGNHNDRFFKRLREDPKWFGLRAMEYRNLLGYDQFGFEWRGDPWDTQANEEWQAAPGITFVHGTRVARLPGYSVQRELASRLYDSSLVMGHCHRGAITWLQRPDQSQVVGVEGFCLCQTRTEYARFTNWTQGVVFITVPANGPLNYELIPFARTPDRLIAHWRGQEYSVSISNVYKEH